MIDMFLRVEHEVIVMSSSIRGQDSHVLFWSLDLFFKSCMGFVPNLLL